MNRYRKGWRAELDVVRELKRDRRFHTVIRSSGSRSAFDIVAIGRSQMLLVQVKTGRGSWKVLVNRLQKLRVPRCVSKEVRVLRDREWLVIQVK